MKRIDIALLISIIGLSVFSVLFVYSSSIGTDGTLQSAQFYRQLMFVLVGMVFMVAMIFVPLHHVKNYMPVLYVLVLVVLAMTLLFGQVRNGARSWIDIGGFSLQISEFAKIAVILMYAFLIERYTPDFKNYTTLALYALVGVFPMGLVLLQPDMGTALVYIPLTIAVFYLAGTDVARVFFVAGAGFVAIVTLIVSFAVQSAIAVDASSVTLLRTSNFYIYLVVLMVLVALSFLGRKIFDFLRHAFTAVWYLALLLATGGALAYAATIVLKPYQLRRLLVFVNPESDPLGSGWHILQSVAAIGSGGITGAGFLQGRQSSLQFLPQKSTDFIFSLIGEELGFLGSICVIMLYALLLWRLLIIGMRSKTVFSRLCCAGIFAVFLTHFMVNVGMTLGVMPVTGIPLLLVSYGGSSTLTSFVALGLAHCIYRIEGNSITLIQS